MKLLTISLLTTALLSVSPAFAQNEGTGKVRRLRKTKGAKAPKTPKTPKSPKSMTPDSLVALVQKHWEYSSASESNVFGSVAVRSSLDGSALLSIDITGLATSTGQAMITKGMSCDPAGAYDETPHLCDESGSVIGDIETLSEGARSVSKSAFRIANGCSKAENMGKTVIITDGTGSVACGVLGDEVAQKVLVADMGSYPGYDGSLTPNGKVTVAFNDDDTFTFSYDVMGLKGDCMGCGIHIHAGTSCATADDPKGHGWNSVVVQDLWTTAGGATYKSDSTGHANGYFSLTNGYGYEANVHHAVVIHTEGGARVGCGILM